MKQIFTLLAATAALSIAGAPAQAQTFSDVMKDIGLQSRENPDIDYNERAPLVVPPALDQLPPPEDAKALSAANPLWPNDPDAARARKLEEEDNRPDRLKRKYSEAPSQDIYKIRRQERVAATSTKDYDPTISRENKRLTRDELRVGTKEKVDEDKTVFVAEPPRRRLTDPPEGYRTPSPNQPYSNVEVDKKTGEPKKSWLTKINPFR